MISDFGGSGLTGAARAIGTAEAGRLGAFWRASGRSNETDAGATGGRFGIGKDTFRHASGSRTFVALSRERCGRLRILGQAGLGPRTTPDGRRWTDVSDLGGAIDPAAGLTLPLEDREAADVDRLLGLGALRSRHAERHGLPDTGLSIAILDPAPLEEGMTLAQFVAAALGPLLAIGRIRILAGGEEIRPEIFDALGREDGLRLGAAAAVPQELPPLVLEDDWDVSIRDWAEVAEADPSRPMAVEAHPAVREDLAVRIGLAPRTQGQKTAWYGIRRGAFVLHAPQGRAVDGATVLMDVRGSLISEILAHAEGPSHSRWEMEQARIHRGRSRKSEAEIGLVSRILGLPKTIWSEIRREESQEKAIPMDGFAAGVAALLGPIPTPGRVQTDQGRPGNGGTGDCPPRRRTPGGARGRRRRRRASRRLPRGDGRRRTPRDPLEPARRAPASRRRPLPPQDPRRSGRLVPGRKRRGAVGPRRRRPRDPPAWIRRRSPGGRGMARHHRPPAQAERRMTDVVHHTLREADDLSIQATLDTGAVVVSANLPECPAADRIQVDLRVSGTNARAGSHDLPYAPGSFGIRLDRPRGIPGRRLLVRLLACDRDGRILWQVLDHPVLAGPEAPAGLGFSFEPDPDAPPGSG